MLPAPMPLPAWPVPLASRKMLDLLRVQVDVQRIDVPSSARWRIEREVIGGGPAMDEVGRAARIRTWLLVPDIHPFMPHAGASPRAWPRDAGNDGVMVGVLSDECDDTRVRPRPDRRRE